VLAWLVGDDYSLADIAVVPFVKRIDEEIAPDEVEASKHPGVAEWVEHDVDGRELAVVATVADAVDRRRLLLTVQVYLIVIGSLLAAFTAAGSEARSCGRRVFTRSTTAMMLAPGWR